MNEPLTWREIITIAAELFAIVGVLLALAASLAGVFYYWPRFLKEKRIENANENSWRVLELLSIAEDAIRPLFWAYKVRKPDQQQFEIQKNVLSVLKNLWTGLLVLQKTTPEMSQHLEWLDSVIKAHEIRIRAVRKNDIRAFSTSTDLLEDLMIGSYSTEEPDFVKFEELRRLLASIAGLYHSKLNSKKTI